MTALGPAPPLQQFGIHLSGCVSEPAMAHAGARPPGSSASASAPSGAASQAFQRDLLESSEPAAKKSRLGPPPAAPPPQAVTYTPGRAPQALPPPSFPTATLRPVSNSGTSTLRPVSTEPQLRLASPVDGDISVVYLVLAPLAQQRTL